MKKIRIAPNSPPLAQQLPPPPHPPSSATSTAPPTLFLTTSPTPPSLNPSGISLIRPRHAITPRNGGPKPPFFQHSMEVMVYQYDKNFGYGCWMTSSPAMSCIFLFLGYSKFPIWLPWQPIQILQYPKSIQQNIKMWDMVGTLVIQQPYPKGLSYCYTITSTLGLLLLLFLQRLSNRHQLFQPLRQIIDRWIRRNF